MTLGTIPSAARKIMTVLVAAGSLALCYPAAAQDSGALSGGGAIAGGSGAPGSGVGIPGMFQITPAMMDAINVIASEETRMMRQGRRMQMTPAVRRAMRVIMTERRKMQRRHHR